LLQGIESKEIHNYFDLAYPNGISAAYTYDSRGGLTGLVYTDSSSTIIDTYEGITEAAKHCIGPIIGH